MRHFTAGGDGSDHPLLDQLDPCALAGVDLGHRNIDDLTENRVEIVLGQEGASNLSERRREPGPPVVHGPDVTHEPVVTSLMNRPSQHVLGSSDLGGRRRSDRHRAVSATPLGDYELATLTPSMLRAWLADLTRKKGRGEKKLSPASVSQAYRTLNRVLVAAVEDELLGRNPLTGVKPPRVEPKEMRFLTHAEVSLLAQAIDKRYKALVLVAA